MIRALVVASLAILAGCIPDKATTYNLSFGSYSASPVVVIEMTVNDHVFGMVPQLVDGRSDEVRPRANAGLFSMRYPLPRNDRIALNVTWVEVLTGRAFTATTQITASDLEKTSYDGLEFAPVFGPNGLMLVTSDPIPTSESDQPTRDLVRICGKRSPSDDVDYRAAPDSLPDLANVLHSPRPPVGASECPTPEM